MGLGVHTYLKFPTDGYFVLIGDADDYEIQSVVCIVFFLFLGNWYIV